MGALRQRARRILQVTGVPDFEADLNRLFGYEGDESDKTKVQRSRIDTREVALRGKVAKQIRVRLDRFSQAPVEGGLFDSAPVWKVKGDAESGKVSFWWRIRDYQNGEAALLLHLLRDMWTEDLPLGGEKGVGRGRLRGVSAKIAFPEGNARIEQEDKKSLRITDPHNFLTAFNLPLNQLFTPHHAP